MKSTYRILSVFIILAIMTSIVSLAESSNQINQQINKPIIENMDQVTKLIPQAKPPQGFTEDQIQKAKEVTIKEIEKITKNLSTQSVNTVSTPKGDAMYIMRSPIDDQYVIFSYYTCNPNCYPVYPDLKIPLKTEIWDNNFNPKSGGDMYSMLYFWNYYTSTWTQISFDRRTLDTNGISRYGVSIPYRYYSDKYYINQLYQFWDGNRWQFQYILRYFSVRWT